MKFQVLNLDGTSGTGEVELSDDVFGIAPRADILHRVVTWQLENRRGTARPARCTCWHGGGRGASAVA